MADLDFKAIEKKWQKRWDEQKLFEPEPEKRKKFYITVAFPYPSGGMHVGHIRTYTVPDIIARFKRMQGYNVLFPMGWHVTGTPIVGAVNRLKMKEAKQLHVLKDVFRIPEKDFKKLETPMGFANYFIDNHYRAGMRALGFTIDWRRQFTTNDLVYNQFVTWQHGKLFEQGLEKEGLHPVKWCLHDNNPVTAHDLLEGENAEMQEFTLLKFKFGKEWLVAATMRPETVYGQTNLWINPETEYVRISIDGQTWIVSQECAEKLQHQKFTLKVEGKVKGTELAGKVCTAPGINREIPIFPSGFCDPNMGTGIVTSVPSDAPYDYIALEELKKDKKWAKAAEKVKLIPIIKTEEYGQFAAPEVCKKMGIKSLKETEKLEAATKEVYKIGFHKGTMVAGPYSGQPVVKAKDAVRKDLEKLGLAGSMMDFSEKVKCRCGGKVVIAREKSWFIDYANPKWKEKAKKAVAQMRSIPEPLRNEYLNAINWLGEWPCVRNFGLGTHLPQDPKFMIEPLSDSTIYMAFYTISHLVKNLKPEQLTKGFFDFVFLDKGESEKVSNETNIPKQELDKIQHSFKYWYPLDWRTSANDLIQNHLTFMLFHHTAVWPDQKMWPKGIVVFGMGVLEGGKMSSSKGNVVLAGDAIGEWGADTVRLFLMSSAEPWQDFDWKAKEIRNYKERLLSFYDTVMRLWNTGKESKKLEQTDKWLLSEVNQIIEATTEGLEGFQTRKASLECLFRFWDVLRWYIRRTDKPNKTVLRQALEVWVKLLTPYTPHISEELWEATGHTGFVSVGAWPEADKNAIDFKLNKAEEIVTQTLNDIQEIIKLRGRPKSVNIYTAPEWKHAVYNSILKAVDPKNIIGDLMSNPEIRKYGEHAVKLAQELSKDRVRLREILSEKEEFAALKSAEKFFRREIGFEVNVLEAQKSRAEKALRAQPGKPGIELVF